MTMPTNGGLRVLQRSPLDLTDTEPAPPETDRSPRRFKPSRFNVQTLTEDGKLMIWNTLKGSMSVFAAHQAETVRSLLRKGELEAEADGIVGYLSRRGFLVGADVDEYRAFQMTFGHQQYRTDMLQLCLLSSEDCNFRCKYCYETFQRGTMKPWVRDGVRRMVENQAPALRFLSISWFGGEPLYGFDAIEDLAPFFVEVSEEHSIRYRANMTTNGYLLTPEVSAKLLAWQINDFQITLDGPPDTHDKSRPTRTGGASFDTILSNLEAMSRMEEEFRVAARVNFDPENEPRLDEFLDIFEQRLHKDPRFQLRFRPVGRWGGDNDKNLEVCAADDGNRLRMVWEDRARARGLGTADDLNRDNWAGSNVCYAARPYHFVVGADGKLMKCTVMLDGREENVVGKITPEGKPELDLDRLALWAEPAFETREKCQKCVFLPTCQGCSCPAGRINHYDSCPPVRTHFKDQLKAVELAFGGEGNKVTVGAEAAGMEPSSTEQHAAGPS